MGKSNKGKSPNRTVSGSAPKDEYSLQNSFARINPYHSSNTYQTKDNDSQEYDQSVQPVNNNFPNYGQNTNTGIVEPYYFRLEDKIEDLSNKNDTAHENLRKEIKHDIQSLADDVKDCISKKNFWTVIGIIIPIILAIAGGIVAQISLANKNKDKIIEMNTTIERSIIPTIEGNSKKIDRIETDVKSNTEKLIQIQNQKKK